MLEHFLSLQQLGYKLILSLDLFLEHVDDVVLALEHIGQVAGKRREAIVAGPLRLALLNRHAALEAVVRPFALHLLVLYDIHPLHHHATVDARHGDVGADCLVSLYFCANAFGFALVVTLAFHWLVAALRIMLRDLRVAQYFVAAHQVVPALELHLLQLFLDLLFDAKESRVRALHRALACFVVKLLEAFVMETALAGSALDWVHENGLAESAEILSLQLILCEQVR